MAAHAGKYKSRVYNITIAGGLFDRRSSIFKYMMYQKIYYKLRIIKAFIIKCARAAHNGGSEAFKLRCCGVVVFMKESLCRNLLVQSKFLVTFFSFFISFLYIFFQFFFLFFIKTTPTGSLCTLIYFVAYMKRGGNIDSHKQNCHFNAKLSYVCVRRQNVVRFY